MIKAMWTAVCCGALLLLLANAAGAAESEALSVEMRDISWVSVSLEAAFDFAILNDIDLSPQYSLAKAGTRDIKQAGRAKSLLNFMFDTRGTDWSQEGAELAINGTSKLRSEATKHYLDQLYRDDMHWSVITQIGRAAGAMTNLEGEDNARSVVQSVDKLRDQIGEGETSKILKALAGGGLENLSLLSARSLDLGAVLLYQDEMLDSALGRDAVIKDLKKQLQVFAGKSQGRRVATKVAYSTLTMATLIPTWVAPVAETTFLATMLANGGPEQDKLLKELYLSKRLEKRRELIQREVSLALSARAVSLSTSNSTLYRFAHDFTNYLCGAKIAEKIFE